MRSNTGKVRDLALALFMVCGILAPSAEVLAQAYPAKAVRILVPFPPGGGSDTIARIVAQVAFIVLPVAVRHFEDGKLRGLGVAGPKRAAVAPDVPIMIEAGVPGHSAVQWNGLFAPAKTPQPVLDKLHQAWVTAIKSPEVAKRIIASGAEPSGNSAAEFAAFVKEETDKWAAVAKASGTRLD